MASLGIDTTQYERSAPQGSVLPIGIYTMTVVRVQQKPTKDGTGIYEEVEFDISSPAQYSNRKFWDRFNIVNKSQKAQQIGRECIADLAKAAGINGVISDDQDLLGKTVQAKLIVKESDNPQYPEAKNECRKYYPVGVDVDAQDTKPAAPAAAPAKANWGNAGTPAAAATEQPAAAPWKR